MNRSAGVIALCSITLLSSCVSRRAFEPKSVGSRRTSSIPIEFTLGLPAVRGEVNGRPALLQVNTAANVCVLSGSYAEALGLGKLRATGVSVEGASARTGRTMIETLRLGEQLLASFSVLVMDFDHFTRPFGEPLSGFVGVTLLEQLPITMDFPEATLVIHPDTREGLVVPIFLKEGVVAALMEVDGHRLDMTVGTGHTATEISAEAWAQLSDGRDVTYRHVAMLDAARETRKRFECCTLGAFRLGELTGEGLRVQRGSENILGMDFLRHYAVTLDIPHLMAYFEPRASDSDRRP